MMIRLSSGSRELDLALAETNDSLEEVSPQEILMWARETFAPEIAASSSFQTQSVPLLHMISQLAPDLPVLFLDTGFHFAKTLAFRDELQARYHLKIVVVRPEVRASDLLARYGEGLYRRDPDLCCHLHKVQPMRRALSGFRAWINGVRRDQTEHRAGLRVLELEPSGLIKIHPMIGWTDREIYAYAAQNNLPSHPLTSEGYGSIGCAPCTRPAKDGEDARIGRWTNTSKTECGLHTNLMQEMEA